MKLASCSKCFKAIPVKQTSVIDGRRVCNDCKGSIKEWSFEKGVGGRF